MLDIDTKNIKTEEAKKIIETCDKEIKKEAKRTGFLLFLATVATGIILLAGARERR